jgi:hypothetical protein
MSFQDIETGLGHPTRALASSLPQSREDSAFLGLQSSLSLQVFKINSNVQGILKLVDQLGTAKDSAGLRKSLYALSAHSSNWPARLTSVATLCSVDTTSQRRLEPWRSEVLMI